MQDDVAELLRSATRDYANTKVCAMCDESCSYKTTRVWMCSWVSIFEHVCTNSASSVQGSLEQIQSVLNSTEVGLHQLTALVDCRSLHMVSHLERCVREGKSSNPGLT